MSPTASWRPKGWKKWWSSAPPSCSAATPSLNAPRLKRGGRQQMLDVDELEIAETTPEEKVLLIDDAVKQLQVQDPEKARVVVLKFFGGLTNQEVAETLHVTERTVERHWAYAKAWLFQTIRAQR